MVWQSLLGNIWNGGMKRGYEKGWVIIRKDESLWGIWNEKNNVCVMMSHHKEVEVGKIICGNFFLLYSKILFCYYKVI